MLGHITACRELAMKALLLILLLLASGSALADADPRLTQLAAAYNRLHQEQLAVYQQFQMIQELRRNELDEPVPSVIRNYSTTGMDNARSLDYDETVRQQQARQERLQRYDHEISQAYARYLELGNQKKALLNRISELELAQPANR